MSRRSPTSSPDDTPAPAKPARRRGADALAPKKKPAAKAAKPRAKARASKAEAAPVVIQPPLRVSVTDQINHHLANGSFAPGNRLWEVRSSAGPKPRFETPEALWAACVEYFVWASDNPMSEVKIYPTKDEIRAEVLPKLRAMTIGSLCLFLDISEGTWREWRAADGPHYRADLSTVIERVEAVIFETKFSAAAVGLLNGPIISADLGMRQRHVHTGEDGGAIQHAVKARVVLVPAKAPAVVTTRPMDDDE